MNHQKHLKRFAQVLSNDLQAALSEADPDKRDHKKLKSMLDTLSECETKLASGGADTSDWDMLSPGAKKAIEEIIAKDIEERQ